MKKNTISEAVTVEYMRKKQTINALFDFKHNVTFDFNEIKNREKKN